MLLPSPDQRLLWSLADLVLGKVIGEGVARRVYECAIDDRYVIKLEYTDRRDFQNVAEWDLWNAAPKAIKRWLAPCYNISGDGKALLQARCEPCPEHLLPPKLPKALGDMHSANIGLYDGRPVAQDYGRPLAAAMLANAKALTTVKDY